MFYKKTPLCFECTACGACCTGSAGHYVQVSRAEQEAIREHLHISRAWFRRRYLTRVDKDTQGLRLKRDGRCVFLDAQNRCGIYALRPLQCRTYPWWPDLVETHAAWQAEARRCEGMNRGPVIPIKKIEQVLARQTKE